jgi:hypothetical protein
MSAPLNQTAPPPRTYRDALIAAAALQVARKAPPNPAAAVAHLSEQIIAARARAAVWAKAAIGGLWVKVNPYDDKAVAAFATRAAELMGSAQTAAARAAAAGQAQQLAAAGIRVDAAPSNPVDIRAPKARIADGKIELHHHGVTVDYGDDTVKVSARDATTAKVFERPAVTFRYVESTGADDAAQQASLRIDTLIDDNLMLAQRLAQQEVIAKAVDLDAPSAPKITGYRRVIHPELSRTGTCGLCIAAADRIYHVAELLPIHAHCKCTIAAVTENHDPGDDVNQADFKALYKAAGGTSAAHLKRTRYQIDDHGELGPVLIPAKPYKPRPKKKPAPTPVTPRQRTPQRDAANAKLSALLDSIDLTGGTD